MRLSFETASNFMASQNFYRTAIILYISASCFLGIPLQSLHIMAQHIFGRIAEHFPDVFFGNPVGQSDCRSERIASHLGGKPLGNPSTRRYLFQVFIHFLD